MQQNQTVDEGPKESKGRPTLKLRVYPKYWVVPETSGVPKILGITRCFGSDRVSKEIPGSGTGLGTCWALQLSDMV